MRDYKTISDNYAKEQGNINWEEYVSDFFPAYRKEAILDFIKHEEAIAKLYALEVLEEVVVIVTSL